MMAQPRPRNDAATIPSSSIGAIPPPESKRNTSARPFGTQPSPQSALKETQRDAAGRNAADMAGEADSSARARPAPDACDSPALDKSRAATKNPGTLAPRIQGRWGGSF